jgi:hypothetical protein
LHAPPPTALRKLHLYYPQPQPLAARGNVKYVAAC